MLLANSMILSSVAQDKVKGFYHPYKKTFTADNITPHEFGDEYEKCLADRFIGDLSIVELARKQYVMIGAALKPVYSKGLGVIDTAGIIRIPCTYDGLRPFYKNENKYYYFEIGDSTGMVDNNGKELIRLDKNIIDIIELNVNTLDEHHKQRMHQIRMQTALIPTLNPDLVIVRVGYSAGLFSLSKGDYEIPIYAYGSDGPYIQKLGGLYPLEAKEDLVLCREEKGYCVVDLKTPGKTPKYDYVYLLDSGQFYIRDKGKHIIADNVANPQSVFGREIIEFRKLNKRRWPGQRKKDVDCYFNAIVKENGKYGVYDEEGQEIIPIKYDDVYMITGRNSFEDGWYFWVKRDGWWALSNAKHELITHFIYQDIDQLNKVSYDNFIYFTKMDTARIVYNSEVADTSDVSFYTHISVSMMGGLGNRYWGRNVYAAYWNAIELPKSIDKKVLHWYGASYAKQKDGYHAINYYSNEEVRVDSNAFEQFYSLPATSVGGSGVMKNGKYAYYHFHDYNGKEQELEYDGLVYLPGLRNGSGVVKGKHIYREPYDSKSGKFKKYREYEPYYMHYWK